MTSYHNWLIAAGMCALIAACSDPQGDWESAREEDTRQAYEAFLGEYPQGTYADRARARIAEMEREAAWSDAQSEGTAEAYAAFLNQYPDGAHSDEATEQRTRLEREAEWERIRAQESTSVASLREFVAAYPDSIEAARARSLIASLETEAAPGTGESEPSEPVGGTEPTSEAAAATETTAPAPAASTTVPAASATGDYRVQLGAFRAQNSANAERARLDEAHGALLGEVTVDAPAGGSGFYRVQSAPMSREAARDACVTLEKEEQACIVVDVDS